MYFFGSCCGVPIEITCENSRKVHRRQGTCFTVGARNSFTNLSFSASWEQVAWYKKIAWNKIQWLFMWFRTHPRIKTSKITIDFVWMLFLWSVFWVLMLWFGDTTHLKHKDHSWAIIITTQKEFSFPFTLTSFGDVNDMNRLIELLIHHRTPLRATKMATDKTANLPLKCTYLAIMICWRFRDYIFLME